MKCVGVFGRLFGHKFIKQRGGHVYSANYCFRCGMLAGSGEVKHE